MATGLKTDIARKAIQLSWLTMCLDKMKAQMGDLRECEGLDRLSSELASLSRTLPNIKDEDRQHLTDLGKQAQRLRMTLALNRYDVEDPYDLPDSWHKTGGRVDITSIHPALSSLADEIYSLHKTSYEDWQQDKSFLPKLAGMMKPRQISIQNSSKVYSL